MEVIVTGGKMTTEEQRHYIRYILDKYPRTEIEKLYLDLDGDFVNISIEPQKRVLTKMCGAFIGDPLKWNDAKRVERYDTVPNRIDSFEFDKNRLTNQMDNKVCSESRK